MKKLGLSLMAAFVFAQAVSGVEATWLTDLAKATTTAKQEKKLILLDFTGSDWCPPCKALHKNVLSSAEFVEFANKNLVLVTVDFPNGKKLPPEQKKANDALAKKYEIKGFPTVIVLDSTGKEISKEVGYSGTPAKDFVANLEKLLKKS